MRALLLAVTSAALIAGTTAPARSAEYTGDWTEPATILIGLVAIVLIVLTIGVWRLSDHVVECCAKNGEAAIRGYLFPLAPDLYKEGGGGAFVLTKLGNFGRTPCILKESYLESVAAEPSGSQPIYQTGRLLKHDLVFDVNAQDVRLSAPALPITGAANSYLVGYFRYLDVFGVSHTTRYCYLVQPATASFERAGSAAWNAFD